MKLPELQLLSLREQQQPLKLCRGVQLKLRTAVGMTGDQKMKTSRFSKMKKTKRLKRSQKKSAIHLNLEMEP